MLATTEAGIVRHKNSMIHHNVRRPNRREAEAAMAVVSDAIERAAANAQGNAAELRTARDTLALVVSTAY
jgi:hypothetical protein